MSLKSLRLRHIRLNCFHWIRSSLRGGAGISYLLIALFCGLGIAHSVITPIELRMKQMNAQGQEVTQEAFIKQVVEHGRPIVLWALGDKSKHNQTCSSGVQSPHPSMSPQPPQNRPTDPAETWASFLLDKRPALLSVIIIIMMCSIPLLVPIAAFNQISADVQSLGMRYILLRTARVNIFFGRFLGTIIFSTLVMLLIIATITLYLGAKIKIYPAADLFLWSLHGFLALTILMIPYIALCSCISALVDSPFFSLALANLVIGGVVFFAFLGSLTWKPLIYLKYALPWGLQNQLLHPQLSHSLGTALACLGYTAVFLLLGYLRFQTRDL